MTKEDKELLLKDLCARLPYGIVLNVGDIDIKLDRKHQGIGILYPEDCSDEFNKNYNEDFYIIISGCYYGNDIKPYLRPLLSMTKEEREELRQEHIKDEQLYTDCIINHPEIRGLIIPHFAADWCDKNMFDHRGLIKKDLALDCTGLHIYD